MFNYNPEIIQRDINTHVLIDADCVAYWGAAGCDGQALRTATRRVDLRMNQILDECSAGEYTGYLTGKNNFRDNIATLQRYKGNRYDKLGKRITPQPEWLQECRQYLIDKYGCIFVQGQEADDALSIHLATKQTKGMNYIISSIDKDLRINVGVHHDMNSGELSTVPEEFIPLDVIHKIGSTGKKSTKVTGSGLMFFYAQLLMGDSADWIKGLPKVNDEIKEKYNIKRKGGCGQMAAVNILDGVTTEKEAHDAVWFCYKSYWSEHSYKHWYTGQNYESGLETARLQLTEQGRLLWMRQKEGELWEPKYQTQ